MQRSTHALSIPAGQRHRRRLALVSAAAAATFWFGSAPPAHAQYTTPPPGGGIPVDTQTSPVVQSLSQSATGGSAHRSQARSSAGGQSLPVTGGDVIGLAALGAGAVVVGRMLVTVRRRSAGV